MSYITHQWNRTGGGSRTSKKICHPHQLSEGKLVQRSKQSVTSKTSASFAQATVTTGAASGLGVVVVDERDAHTRDGFRDVYLNRIKARASLD